VVKSFNGSSEGSSVFNWEWGLNRMHRVSCSLKVWNNGASGSLAQSSKARFAEWGILTLVLGMLAPCMVREERDGKCCDL
jgi:hypothetical protein